MHPAYSFSLETTYIYFVLYPVFETLADFPESEKGRHSVHKNVKKKKKKVYIICAMYMLLLQIWANHTLPRKRVIF